MRISLSQRTKPKTCSARSVVDDWANGASKPKPLIDGLCVFRDGIWTRLLLQQAMANVAGQSAPRPVICAWLHGIFLRLVPNADVRGSRWAFSRRFHAIRDVRIQKVGKLLTEMTPTRKNFAPVLPFGRMSRIIG
jgi:hypothetical protein